MPLNRSTPPLDPGLAVEAEVRANVLAQVAGAGTVADLNLPSDFVGRVADRAIRGSFYERHRAVVSDVAPASVPEPDVQQATPSLPVSSWDLLPERSPALASFRSPESDGARTAVRRLTDPSPSDPSQHRHIEPRRIIRTRLAREGLLPTLARVILHLGPDRFTKPSQEHLQALADVGLPMDLLEWFHFAGSPQSSTVAIDIVAHIAGALAGGERIEKIEKTLRRTAFQPIQSLPGFRPTSENGDDEPYLLRAQMTRGTHYAGPGDGGCVDLVAGVLRALPTCDAILATQDKHAPGVREIAAAHAGAGGRSIRVVSQHLPVSQWAGDNSKSGSILHEGARLPAQLVPRFAGRREDATIFIPGDDLAVATGSISPAAMRSARSPLLFEGGNLLVCDDVKRGGRVLLVGEAELYRNQSLGLTREQAHEALRTEFGASSCIVLPASSYHIDHEVTVRVMPDGRMLAFLPDAAAGIRLVLQAGIGALRKANRWPEDLVAHAAESLTQGHYREFLTLLWTGLGRERTPEGAWPVSFAEVFSASPADSGVGNLHRVLLAADCLAAEVSDASEFSDGHYRALVRSLVRREQDRRSLRSKLEGIGWKIALVPAMPEDSRGVNPLNGIQLRDRYLMPAYGGLFWELDRAAIAAFSSSLGVGVEVIPITTGESQRRQGAIHCSIAICGW